MMYEAASGFFISELLRLLQNNKISPKSQPAIAWFVTLLAKKIPAATADPTVISIVKWFLKSNPNDFGDLRTLFCLQLGNVEVSVSPSDNTPKTFTALKELLPVHDNDFPLDYRKISVFPTANEINTQVSMHRVLQSVDKSRSATSALLLDRQFRLLREDMLTPMKEELKDLFSGGGYGKKKLKFEKPNSISAEAQKNTSYVKMEFDMPKALFGRLNTLKDKKSVITFFETQGRRILSKNSVLLFISGQSVMHMGFVSFREASLLAFDPVLYQDSSTSKSHKTGEPLSRQQPLPAPKPPPPPVRMMVGVTFLNDSLNSVLSQLGGKPVAEFMLQSNSSMFSYQPVLNCLQGQLL